MKREIKFRAMCDADGIQKMVVFGAEEFDDGVKAWPMPNNISRIDSYDSPLMQYTGLKDRNGKEIYEGDVIQDGWNKNTFGVVTFEEGGFRLGFGYAETVGIQSEVAEVIGNIYENPELANYTEK